MLAVGLTMPTELIDEFRRRINEYAADKIMPVPELSLDCELPLSMINTDLVSAAERLEPFGANNPSPVIAVRNLTITKIVPVGGGYHQRLQLTGMGMTVTAMLFGTMTSQFAFRTGDTVDCAVAVGRSDFRGDRGVSVIIRDIRLSETDVEEVIAVDRAVECLLRGEPVTASQAEKMIPERSDFETIYRFLAHIGFRGTYDILWARIKQYGISYEKMRVALCAMTELGLIDTQFHAGVYSLRINKVSFKADLETSSIIKLLRRCMDT